MCGLVGAVAERDVTPILVEGLKRLEYRGYDSAGVAVLERSGTLTSTRRMGKVKELEDALEAKPLVGGLGIAHTRWATHGVPAEHNAHPHCSGEDLALVHNGIIENHEALRAELQSQGYEFKSETDTEVIVHRLHRECDAGKDLFDAVQAITHELDGAYGLAVMDRRSPEELVVARRGSPLVIGIGIGENFAASDVAALLPVTRRFIYLEEGDVARVRRESIDIVDVDGNAVEREIKETDLSADAVEKGPYRHYMLKEIFEQPRALNDTWHGRVLNDHLVDATLGPQADELLAKVENVHIVACGTSWHAGTVARYWVESVAKVPCNVELASEYRYRQPMVPANTLLVTISQSGETADTLAALSYAKQSGYLGSLCVCNVPQSSLVRESDLAMMTHAGPEIGVASTKAFTTQLMALLMFTLMLARKRGMTAEEEAKACAEITESGGRVEEVLLMDQAIKDLSEEFADTHNALFLGRGPMYPVAMEGALKLKEISYIHAEAYAAGELKHGPLALVDEDMPVIAVAPNDELLEKLKSNLQEVKARGGRLYVFADKDSGMKSEEGLTVIDMPHCSDLIAPIVYTIPLQLLSYHVAVLKGTDVDQPRNLAKSVTVE